MKTYVKIWVLTNGQKAVYFKSRNAAHLYASSFGRDFQAEPKYAGRFTEENAAKKKPCFSESDVRTLQLMLR